MSASPSESVLEAVRDEIDALVSRYDLAEGAADALQGLVRLVDWTKPNFVPSSDSSRRRERPRPADARIRTASGSLADSLAGLELEPVRAARRLADIGSGAGFPGMVLAIAIPQARVALIDKDSEPCSFLRRAATELGLDNVEVVEGPVRQWSEGVGAFDVVTLRKVRPKAGLKWSERLLAPGGAAVVWPGRTRDFRARGTDPAEVGEAAGLRLAHVHALPLQNSGRRRSDTKPRKHLYVYLKPEDG